MFISLDLSTQGAKATVFNAQGTPIICAARYYPTRTLPGGLEQDPSDWLEAANIALLECLERVDRRSVKVMAITGTSCTPIVSDEHGQPLRPAILWGDTRAHREAQLLNRLGSPCVPEDGLPKALWMKWNEPNLWQRASIVSEGLDWVNYQLTGRWGSCTSTLIRKWDFTEDQGWPVRLLRRVGLEDLLEKFPPVILRATEVIGLLRPKWARHWGLRRMPVIATPYDTASAALGLGLLEPCEDIALILGSSAGIIAQPTFDKRDLQEDWRGWGPYRGLITSGVSALASGVAYAGLAVRDFVQRYCRTELQEAGHSNRSVYDLLDAQAQAVPACSGPLVILPGNRLLDQRFTLSLPELDGIPKAQALRALYEAVAAEIAYLVADLRRKGFRPHRARVGGGLALSRLFVEILADTLGLPLLIVERPESVACRGAAMAAAVGVERYETLEEAVTQMIRWHDVIYPDEANCRVYENFLHKRSEDRAMPSGRALSSVGSSSRRL